MTAIVADGWELVVGLEVHVEVTATRTKMFCGCRTDFGAPPNTNVCPVCAGLPGSLPVVNAAAVEAATRLGLALGCDIAATCRFHRKNYFYPDMPKDYQISQYDVPLCADGHLDLDIDGETRRVRIERVHMEEDTGKSLHLGGSGRIHGADRSLIDYNRAGIPLLEVVSHPDIRDAETAQAYLRELQGIVQALGVSDGRLEEGSMRCDANVSVRRPGAPLGTRAEVKNLNSVRSLGRAIAFEGQRQVAELEDGGTIVAETRHWDEGRGVTETLRRKETVTDYRYFPDPDLVELHSPAAAVEALRATLPELPAAARARLVDDGVAPAQAATIVGGDLLAWYDGAVAAGADHADVANWLAGEVTANLNARGIDPAASGLDGGHVAELVGLVEDGTLSRSMAKQVLEGVFDGAGTVRPADVAREQGLEQVSDEASLQAAVDQAIADNPDAVASIEAGNDKAVGALVGAVMRSTGGQADPRVTQDIIRRTLAERA